MWSLPLYGKLCSSDQYVCNEKVKLTYVGEKIVDKIVGRHCEPFPGEVVGEVGASAEEAVILIH